MKLTPLDIRKQEFKRSMRGFDPDEVEAFLTMVADEFELMIREKNQLNDEAIKLRTQLKDYQQVENTLRDTLVKAQNTIEDTKANSKREAEIIIHEAELQAENIIKDAKEELMRLRNEAHMVRAQKESFANRLRHLLGSQIELLEVLEMDDDEMDPRRARAQRRQEEMSANQREQAGQGLGEQRKQQPPIIRNTDNPGQGVRTGEQQHPDNQQNQDPSSNEFIR